MKNLLTAIATVAFLFVAMIGMSERANAVAANSVYGGQLYFSCLGIGVCLYLPADDDPEELILVPGVRTDHGPQIPTRPPLIPELAADQIEYSSFFLPNEGSETEGIGIINGCLYYNNNNEEPSIVYTIDGQTEFQTLEEWQQAR